MENAASNLMVASYRNQTAHVFVRVAIIALAVNSCTTRDVITMGLLLFLHKFWKDDLVFKSISRFVNSCITQDVITMGVLFFSMKERLMSEIFASYRLIIMVYDYCLKYFVLYKKN